MEQNSKPIQKILFGSPGTGKSYQIREIAQESLGIKWNDETKSLENTIKTVFHPEYTYSDFMGKLLPLTDEKGNVIYKFYPGHFLQALGLAYRKIIEGGDNQNVLLVIDELNRGNAAAIFGPVFQLLDREEDSWSTYDVNLSELETVALLKFMEYKTRISGDNIEVQYNGSWNSISVFCDGVQNLKTEDINSLRVLKNLKNYKISIPHNLSIVATINTSDESIYYLDSAFKRRWDWEYVDAPGSHTSEIPEPIKNVFIIWQEKICKWSYFVVELNQFIKSNYKAIRRIEEKQIGWWFLKSEENGIIYDIDEKKTTPKKIIAQQAIENKLMFYLWDSVFSKDKRPLQNLLSENSQEEVNLITFADFVRCSDIFINALIPEDKWEE